MKNFTIITLISAAVFSFETVSAQNTKASSIESVTPVQINTNTGKRNSKASKTAKPAAEKQKKTETTKINTTATTPVTIETAPNNAKVNLQTTAATNNQIENTPLPDYSVVDKYAEPIVQEKTNGNINWTQQYVEAKGQAVIDTERFPNISQARAMATRGAVVVAQRNLLEIVKGVNVVGETTVQDMATTSDYIYTRVEGLVKGAEQVGQAREMNGMMEVTLRMPIYGKVGITGALEDADITNAQRKMGLQPLMAMAATENIAAGEDVVDGSKPLVFNFKGKQIDPSMFPIIVDDKGNVKLDFSKIYDPNTGKFPKYMQLSKEIMQDLNLKKGVDIIELVQNSNGQFTLPQSSQKRVVWQKIGNVAQKIGKVLFSFL